MLTLTEQGLYFFLGRSDKQKALPFQKWIAGVVLPSIRRTGAYVHSGASLPVPAVQEGSDTLSRLGLPADVLKVWPRQRVNLLGLAVQIARMDAEQAEKVFKVFGDLCAVTAAKNVLYAKEPLRQETPVYEFSRERLVQSNQKMQARTLYESFTDWCYSRDLTPCSMRRFCTTMRSLFSVHESNKVYFHCMFVTGNTLRVEEAAHA